MTFAHPYFFLLFLPMFLAVWMVYRKNIKSGIIFAPTHRLPDSQTTWRAVVALILPVFFFLGLSLAIIAAARPRTLFSRSHRTSDVIGIEMVVDVSGSMKALDMSDIRGNVIEKERTRLDVVKKTFAQFVEKQPADLIGLVSFGGYATTRAPLTLDHSALLHVLKGLQVPDPAIGKNGKLLDPDELNTAIGDALTTGCARLEKAKLKSKIIVLLTDGVSNTGIIQPEDAIKVAKELKIKIYTIGVGSTGSAPFKTQQFGQPMIVSSNVELDEDLLRNIAKQTGGIYFNVRDPKGLASSLEKIGKLEKTKIENDVYNQYNELFPYILILAIILIVMATGLNMLIVKRII